jgi:valyl-tRNA synthetase
VEATKLSIKSVNDAEKDPAPTVLLDVLAKSLRLLHPLPSFITEEIYSKLPNIEPGELLITAPYPEYEEKLANPKAEREFSFLQDLVRQIRTLRSECTIPPDRKLKVRLRGPGREDLLKENADLLRLLAGIGDLEIESDLSERPSGSIGLAGSGYEAFVFIADAVDMKLLKQKFGKELEKDHKYIEGLKAKLANANFIKNAPPELVNEEKTKLEESLKRTGKLESYIRDMV